MFIQFWVVCFIPFSKLLKIHPGEKHKLSMFHYVVVEPPLWNNNIVKVDMFSPKFNLKNQETSLKQPPLLQIYMYILICIRVRIYIYIYGLTSKKQKHHPGATCMIALPQIPNVDVLPMRVLHDHRKLDHLRPTKTWLVGWLPIPGRLDCFFSEFQMFFWCWGLNILQETVRNSKGRYQYRLMLGSHFVLTLMELK